MLDMTPQLVFTRTIRNATTPELVEYALQRKEGTLTHTGAFSVQTGTYTGRSPKDKFIVVEDPITQDIHWGTTNQPFAKDQFTTLLNRVLDYLSAREVFVLDAFAGAAPECQMPVQEITELAWHNLFAKQLFIKQGTTHLQHNPFQVISAPGFKADPTRDGTRSEAFVIISFEERIVLIGGTEYAGEIKKSIFTVMNYLLPKLGVLSMHCSANMGLSGNTALFFGLSGTGKTTLSTDPNRGLIGDDEHGWSENGVFNIEGGCYAKCIHLSEEREPEIWGAVRFGTVLENVVLNQERVPNYEDASLTENTRAAYPLDSIPNVMASGQGNHPDTIIFLTADASGVLPPIAKLTEEQIGYYFLNGYTSKLAGTERGVTTPEATFSTCFGAPFLPLRPKVYAELLQTKIRQHNARVFLVNTGWSGGPYGDGKRMSLTYTRAMVNAAIEGRLDSVEYTTDGIFGLQIPLTCPGVDGAVLNPIQTWKDQDQYIERALGLQQLFEKNFAQFS